MHHSFHHEEDLGKKAINFKVFKRLLAYASPFWLGLSLCIFLLFLITLADLARPYLLKIAIDEHFVGLSSNNTQVVSDHIQALFKLAAIFLGLIIASSLLSYIQAYLLQYIGQKIIFTIRQKVFEHLLSLPIRFFDTNPVGRLVTRVTNDIESINEMYSSVLVYLFQDIFLIFGIMAVMLSLNLTLSCISFVGIPLIVGATLLYQLKASRAFRQVRVKLAAVNAFLQENLSGMRIIQVFRQEKQKMSHFKQLNMELYTASMQELVAFALFRPAMDLIYTLVLALLIWYGGGQVLQNHLSFGVLYAFINYLEQFFKPINDLTEKYSIFQSALASAERLFLLLDEENTIKEIKEPVELPDLQGKIEFDHVWFAYQNEDWVLKDVTFTIKPGQTFALVGATGAGKSSVINLLNRFYDIQKGEIRIDDIPVQNFKLSFLRSNIGVVMQDVFLFTGDIAHNIRLGNTAITDKQIREAARFVHADSFIEQLSNQYETEVVERGATLSTGERQLLAFARALAFNPKILVLDEATAHIDTATEQLIQEALNKLTFNRTTLIVAHRLSTIQRADCILVMHKGEIKEMGTHQELLSKGGLYYQLYQLQYKDQLS
ncbi:ABC transporter ATP-binding protein [Bacillota bacterium LX-D]|nr:ABC transporter ATP-binding protein [Bacillota bacterium LX-D]